MTRVLVLVSLLLFFAVNVLAVDEDLLELAFEKARKQVIADTIILNTVDQEIKLEPYVYFSEEIMEDSLMKPLFNFEAFEGHKLRAIRKRGNNTWWYTMIKNTSNEVANYYLEVGNNKVSELHFYCSKNAQKPETYKVGLFSDKEVSRISDDIPVLLKPDEILEILIYMPVSPIMLDMNVSNNISHDNLPLKILPVAKKVERSLEHFFSYGVFVGYFILYIFVLSQLLNGFKKPLRFLFMFYTISGGMAPIALTGIGYIYIWKDMVLLESIAVNVFSNLFLLSSFMFFIRAVPVYWHLKWVRPLYYVCTTVLCLNIAGSFLITVLPVPWFWKFYDFRGIGFIVCSLILVFAMIMYWLKVRDKRILPIIVVYFFLIVSIAIAILNTLQIIHFINTYKVVYFLTFVFTGMLTWYLLFRIDILNQRVLMRNKNRLKAIEVGVNLERKRWSRELHDGIGGVIALATLKLSNLESQAGTNTTATALKDLRLELSSAWEEVNSISKNILPENLEKLGLVKAVQQHVQNLNTRSPVKIDTYLKSNQKFNNSTLMLHIYRIVQELLNNSLKHAKASEIKLQLYDIDEQLNLSIEDNGIGFNIRQIEKSKKETGLSNLRKRVKLTGGKIEIESSDTKGSYIHISYPLNLLIRPDIK